ncbi:MAG: V-type ATP synthase subunit D [Brevinematales bacterium]|nr:V-type ATP synthase subunit D [Brevinematales bacterium]
MNLSEIAPTKTNLLEYKGQLKFSQDGHALLEQKREVLVMNLLEVISKIKDQRKRLNEQLKIAYDYLALLELEIGEFEIERLLKGIRSEMSLDIIERSVMGVAVPTIKNKDKLTIKKGPQISISTTTMSYDMLSKAIGEIMKLLLFVAEVEVSAWRLAYEIKKTQRRVNALENNFIPMFKEIVKYIQDTLEERERETFFQMKRVKNAHLAEK